LAGAALAARLAGADPFDVLFSAGVVAAARLAGFTVPWLALVAATYTLSVLRAPAGAGVRHQEASAMRNVGGIGRILAAWFGGRRAPL